MTVPDIQTQSPNLFVSDEVIKGEVRTYYHLGYFEGIYDGGFEGYYSTQERAVKAAEREGLTKFLSDPKGLGCQINPVRIFTTDGRIGFVMGRESTSPVDLDKGNWYRPVW